MADDASRALLLDVLARRVLGPSRVALPVSRAAWTRACDVVAATASGEPIATPAGPSVRRLSWPGAGGHVHLWGDPVQVVPLTGFGQYAVRPRADAPLIVDAGGGWAETALWFADRWPRCEVVSLELDPANAALWQRNRAENPRLASRLSLTRAAAWSRSGEEVDYAPAAGASAVGPGPAVAPTVAIDDLADRPVGLVKLDVEGAELQALEGARATIDRWRPSLAVSIYHRLEDLVDLPLWVARLGLGYELRLGHHTPWLAETVLYARAAR